MPVLYSLRGWAETWLPDDPAMMERDPDVVLGWLAQRVSAEHLPAEPVVLEFWPYEHDRRYWLVLQDRVEPYGCLTDPLLDTGRYVYVRCALPTLLVPGARPASVVRRVSRWVAHRYRRDGPVPQSH